MSAQPIQSSKIIAIDTETTGLDPHQNAIVEIAMKIFDVSSGKLHDSYQSVIKLTDYDFTTASQRALEINGFTRKETDKKGKPKEQVINEICDFFLKNQVDRRNDAFLAWNATFDRGFFDALITSDLQSEKKIPYHWLDFPSMHHGIERVKIATGKIASYCIPYRKDAVAKHYNLPPEEAPHRAMNGVDHMLLIYERVIGFNQNIDFAIGAHTKRS